MFSVIVKELNVASFPFPGVHTCSSTVASVDTLLVTSTANFLVVPASRRECAKTKTPGDYILASDPEICDGGEKVPGR